MREIESKLLVSTQALPIAFIIIFFIWMGRIPLIVELKSEMIRAAASTGWTYWLSKGYESGKKGARGGILFFCYVFLAFSIPSIFRAAIDIIHNSPVGNVMKIAFLVEFCCSSGLIAVIVLVHRKLPLYRKWRRLSFESRMTELNNLLAKGTISQVEFEVKKGKVVKMMSDEASDTSDPNQPKAKWWKNQLNHRQLISFYPKSSAERSTLIACLTIICIVLLIYLIERFTLTGCVGLVIMIAILAFLILGKHIYVPEKKD